MAFLPENSTFDTGVYQIETTDPVIGGPTGVTNTPLKNLTNRTKYLKDHVDALESSRAPLASPAFTGTPTAPTAASGTNTTQIATTAFVMTAAFNAAAASVPSGSYMIFVQTAAPTGWTKQTTHDNKALRIVSGTASSGGSVAFTSAFASQGISGTVSSATSTGTVGGTTLTVAQIPSHNHGGANVNANAGYGADTQYNPDDDILNTANGTGYTGGGGSHTHSLTMNAHNHTFTGNAVNLAVQYVDAIIAKKD